MKKFEKKGLTRELVFDILDKLAREGVRKGQAEGESRKGAGERAEP